jgi:hypothetical protein
MTQRLDDPPSPVYSPDNEPYLGNEHVHVFDLTISRAMQFLNEAGHRTFAFSMNPLQTAAAEIIPQGVSIVLSIREMIRQAYLYPAAILVRPLVERTGMVQYLVMNPKAVVAWHAGWPRKSQPDFQKLLDLVDSTSSAEEKEITRQVLHKLVHSDPQGSKFNLFAQTDGSLAYASGKEIGQPKKAEAISKMASKCLRQLTATSVALFGQVPKH